MLIGIVGLIGSGKDTVANRLVEKHGFVRDSFAKSLKDAVSSMFNWDREMLEGNTSSSRHWREQPDKFWSDKFGKPVTPRWVLQHFGTEVMRGNMYDGIWVDSCLGRYKGKNTVISDTRFPNEVKQIRLNGGTIIRVKRNEDPEWFINYVEGNIEPKGIHSSEYAWAKEEFDFVIENNGNKETLYAKIDELIISNKIANSPSQSSNAA
tara:strand:- start:2184 stop:2807 length:624 start_codon:yes stop_codon:yes gene_type:complete